MENLLNNLREYSHDSSVKIGMGAAISWQIIKYLNALICFAFNDYINLKFTAWKEDLIKDVAEKIKKNDDGK